jgi:hypothetical protein
VSLHHPDISGRCINCGQAITTTDLTGCPINVWNEWSDDNTPAPRYTVERHADGWAIYSGRDNRHHGYNIGRLSECEPGVPEMIEDALNERLQRMIAQTKP